MIQKLKSVFRHAHTKIVIFIGLGTFLVINSFIPAGTTRHFIPKSWGNSFEPIQATIGIVLLAIAWLLYKKWTFDNR